MKTVSDELGGMATASLLPAMSQELAKLPSNLSLTGIEFSNGVSDQEWRAMATPFVKVFDASRKVDSVLCWAIGDWLTYGEHTFGTKWKEAAALLGERWKISTLKQMGHIAKRIEKSSRLYSVSFWHYLSIVKIEDHQQQLDVLRRADEQSWSQRQTKEEVDRLLDQNSVTEVDNPKSGSRGAATNQAEVAVSSIGPRVAAGARVEPESSLPRRDPKVAIIAMPNWKRTPEGEGVDLPDLVSRISGQPRDAVCFLFVPPTRLEDGIRLLEAWGFHYSTCAANNLPNPKEHTQADLWLQAKLELVLIGLRGGRPSVTDDELLWERPIGHFLPGNFGTRVGRWLPNVPIEWIN